jgi:hypothetical protein
MKTRDYDPAAEDTPMRHQPPLSESERSEAYGRAVADIAASFMRNPVI